MVRIHRLVASAFIENPKGLPNVNHIDHDRKNNRVENLEWCTQQGNLAHARAHGRMPDNYWTGKRSPSALLDDDTVRAIRAAYSTGNVSWNDLAAAYGLSKRSIGRLLNRESYADV